MIVPKHYEDLNIVHENTMPYRAYYIPASHDMGALVEDRFSSDRRIMTAAVLWKQRCRESGRIMVMTATSIPM